MSSGKTDPDNYPVSQANSLYEEAQILEESGNLQVALFHYERALGEAMLARDHAYYQLIQKAYHLLAYRLEN